MIVVYLVVLPPAPLRWVHSRRRPRAPTLNRVISIDLACCGVLHVLLFHPAVPQEISPRSGETVVAVEAVYLLSGFGRKARPARDSKSYQGIDKMNFTFARIVEILHAGIIQPGGVA